MLEIMESLPPKKNVLKVLRLPSRVCPSIMPPTSGHAPLQGPPWPRLSEQGPPQSPPTEGHAFTARARPGHACHPGAMHQPCLPPRVCPQSCFPLQATLHCRAHPGHASPQGPPQSPPTEGHTPTAGSAPATPPIQSLPLNHASHCRPRRTAGPASVTAH